MILPDRPLNEARILIVDDNATNVALLEAILEDAGYDNLDSLTDPRQVVARFARDDFDLVLLDIRMPHMDGHEVMARLAEQLPEGDFLPVIVLTAQIDALTRERALAAGARDFITKPFDATEVLQRIENTLEVRALHNQRRAQVSELSETVVRQSETLLDQERSLEYLASHNSITDLPNRRAMIAHVNDVLEQGRPITALLIQVDGHERLESLEGYDFADRVLRLLGERLTDALPEPRQVGYWGSACYLVLLRDADGEQLARCAGQVLDLVVEPVFLQGYELLLSARAGLARAPEDGTNASQLLKRAALALSLAPKTEDKPRLQRFEPAFEEAIVHRHRMEGLLRHAVENGELLMLYQPKVCLNSGKLAGVEALMRWQSPELGMVSPATFIPLAEETGLIARLGQWAVEESLAAAARWRAATGQLLPVAVNVSTRQFDLLRARGESLADQIAQALAASGLPATALELEVTETAIMQDLDYALSQLRQLRALGVQIAIDDFGTGYSSLAYLQQLPVSTLKIDRSLVDGISRSEKTRALIGALVAVTRALELQTVAEGIETPDDAQVLGELGCELAQGFHFHRPLDESRITTLLADNGGG